MEVFGSSGRAGPVMLRMSRTAGTWDSRAGTLPRHTYYRMPDHTAGTVNEGTGADDVPAAEQAAGAARQQAGAHAAVPDQEQAGRAGVAGQPLAVLRAHSARSLWYQHEVLSFGCLGFIP